MKKKPTNAKNIKNKKRKKKKMKLWKKILLVILLLLAILLGWFFYKSEKNGGGLSGMLATIAGHDENTRKNLGEFRCLILGISTDQDGVDLTDTIMIASYNPNTQKATLLSIPRDTYTGRNSAKATAYEKINALYSRKHRADETLEAVNEITGLNIQYYIVVKTEALIKLVDVVGGVTFNVPMDMNYDDTSQDLHIHLKQGEQVLDGDKAEQIVRFRHNNDGTSYPEEYGDNDTGRMRTQREFIMQVLKQTLRADNIWKINEILDIASECLITNVNFDVAKDYVPYAVEFNTEDMLTDVLPGTNTNKNTSGTWIFVHDKQKTKKLVQELFYHRDVSENGEETSLSKLNILILNGTDDDNKLEIAKQGLTSLGYTIKTTKTNKTEKTIIINQTNVSDEEISGIKENLQKGIIKTNTTKNDTYDVKIILGTDFNG